MQEVDTKVKKKGPTCMQESYKKQPIASKTEHK